MGVGGRGKWVMGIEAGTCWDEHWVLYGNQFDNIFHIKKIIKNNNNNKIVYKKYLCNLKSPHCICPYRMNIMYDFLYFHRMYFFFYIFKFVMKWNWCVIFSDCKSILFPTFKCHLSNLPNRSLSAFFSPYTGCFLFWWEDRT